jgi:hypothetical protein
MWAAKMSRFPIDDCSVLPTHSPPLAERSVMCPIQTPDTFSTDGEAGDELSPHADAARKPTSRR